MSNTYFFADLSTLKGEYDYHPDYIETDNMIKNAISMIQKKEGDYELWIILSKIQAFLRSNGKFGLYNEFVYAEYFRTLDVKERSIQININEETFMNIIITKIVGSYNIMSVYMTMGEDEKPIKQESSEYGRFLIGPNNTINTEHQLCQQYVLQGLVMKKQQKNLDLSVKFMANDLAIVH